MVAVAELWQTLTHAINHYTGLSPAAFFTAVAVAAAIYHLIASFLAPPPPAPRVRASFPEEESEPLPPPVQLGEVTEEELKTYNGSDPKKPLLMAIKGQIYDVTQSRMFYGPGGPYALFAGRDASRALAKMSFETEDLTSDISGLGPFELDALQDWEYKFMSKYVKVGTIKKAEVITERAVAADVGPSTTESAPESHSDATETVPKTESAPDSHSDATETVPKTESAPESHSNATKTVPKTESAPESYSDVTETVPKTESETKDTDLGAKDEDVKESKIDDENVKESKIDDGAAKEE